jgi:hypothetical protein
MDSNSSPHAQAHSRTGRRWFVGFLCLVLASPILYFLWRGVASRPTHDHWPYSIQSLGNDLLPTISLAQLATNKSYVAVVDSKETNTWTKGASERHTVPFVLVHVTRKDGTKAAIYEENADVNMLRFLLSLRDKEEYDLSSAVRGWKQMQR